MSAKTGKAVETFWLQEEQEFSLGYVELNLRCVIRLSDGNISLGLGYMSLLEI